MINYHDHDIIMLIFHVFETFVKINLLSLIMLNIARVPTKREKKYCSQVVFDQYRI